MSIDLQSHLELPYSELEELNLRAKEERLARVPAEQIQGERLKYLSDEKRIKAVTDKTGKLSQDMNFPIHSPLRHKGRCHLRSE